MSAIATRSLAPRGLPPSTLHLVLLGLTSLPTTIAQTFDLSNARAIRESASTLAEDTLDWFYSGDEPGEIPGLLPGAEDMLGPYYWYQGGILMNTLIDYWHLTGDDTYNNIVSQAAVHQMGSERDFMPENYTATMGNDDQCIWALVAMTAAENEFPMPDIDDDFQWVDPVKNVFELMSWRFRDEACDGGLRWQILMTNVGYNYKSTFSTACYMDLSARLARYTGNETYAEHASEAWDWLRTVEFVDDEWNVYDGAHVETDCTDINKVQFSYSSAILTHAAAFMYNFTTSDSWLDRAENLAENTISTFFPNETLYEVACEGRRGACASDMLFFKGLVHRWLAASTQLATSMAELILPVLRESTEKAVAQCTGGDSGRQCGFYWARGDFFDPEDDMDGGGAGEQINVLAAVSSLLIEDAGAPVVAETGDSSNGDEGEDGNGNGDDDGGSNGDGNGDSNGSGNDDPTSEEVESDDNGNAASGLGSRAGAVGVLVGLVSLIWAVI